MSRRRTMPGRGSGASRLLCSSDAEHGPSANEFEKLMDTLLCDPDAMARQAAATTLGQIADVQAVELLVAALKDLDGQVRVAAAKALGKIDDRRAIRPLIAAVGDREPDVRLAALFALGSMASARTVCPER